MYFWHEKDFDALRNSRQAEHHALLITGPAGIGKSAFARSWAAALLCERLGPTGRACGACAACNWFGQGHHPDFRTLIPDADNPDFEATGKGAKPAKDIRIDQVRSLAGFVNVGGHRGGRKLILIEPADALNAPAANALLKTLEEPPGNTRFLLVSARPDWLPATIRSRCAVLTLRAPSAHDAAHWLVSECGVPSAEAVGWLAAAGGAPLRARDLAQPAVGATHRLVLATIAGLPQSSAINAAERLASVEPATWVAILQTWLGDLGRVRGGGEPRFHPEQRARFQALARETDLHRISEFDVRIRRLTRHAQHPLNPRLLCEDALLGYCAVFDGRPPREGSTEPRSRGTPTPHRVP